MRDVFARDNFCGCFHAEFHADNGQNRNRERRRNDTDKNNYSRVF
jgi:hypothetical protein